MGESPAAVPPSPKKKLSTGAILGIVFGSLFALGLILITVAVVVLLANADGDDPAAPPAGTHIDQMEEPDEPDAPVGPINIAGMPVDVVDGTVTSACFTFDLPTVVEFEVNPDSIACQVALRIAGSDSLTEINVMAQSGDNSADAFFAYMEDAMSQVSSDDELVTKSLLVDGRPSVYAMVTDGMGLRKEFYQVPVPEGAFESDGTAITSILIVGPHYEEGSEYNQSLVDIVESFSVRD
jgi:hypothetical protein